VLRRRLRTAPLSRLELLLERLAARTPLRADEPGRPLAAVSVVLAPDPDAILLIRRAEREGDHWSGHLALPGGRWSEGDEDLVATARRETFEETSVDLHGADPIAALDDLVPRSPVLPPILVRPFVFVLPAQAPIRPNHEVAGAWWVPIETLLDPGALRPYEYRRQNRSVQAVGYHLEIGVLWGMTERILTPLLDLFSAPIQPT
jgi:ADP-ribose pyrophosphatase YjhB (NUDIX family)